MQLAEHLITINNIGGSCDRDWPLNRVHTFPSIVFSTVLGICFKPIFHQNAKYLASGTFASPNAKDSTFASPNARNTNMLVSLALGDTSFLRWPCTFLFLCVDFFALGSKRKPHFQWNIGCVGCLASGLCVGHVHANPFFGGIWALDIFNLFSGHRDLMLVVHPI